MSRIQFTSAAHAMDIKGKIYLYTSEVDQKAALRVFADLFYVLDKFKFKSIHARWKIGEYCERVQIANRLREVQDDTLLCPAD